MICFFLALSPPNTTIFVREGGLNLLSGICVSFSLPLATGDLAANYIPYTLYKEERGDM